MLNELRRDCARYVDLGGWYKNLGFWVGATYRLGVWAHAQRAPARQLLVLLYRIVKLPWRIVLNVAIAAGPGGVRIGPGLCLIHPRNIVIGGGTEIGEDCLIFHEVTIGTGPTPGLPRIGDKVDLYVGARVLGGIRVGDGSMIGANCVVTQNVPALSVVVPVPSRVLSRALLSRDPSREPPAGGSSAIEG